ncbi:hypothetical protein [Pseudoclavibacter helvolus]|uniref:hypothetical protein n=1 Tax=Pseudoclavibacter helvolus TaxID=255205 RepID=UPI003C726529
MAYITLTEVWGERTELVNTDHIAHFTAARVSAAANSGPAASQSALHIVAAQSHQPADREYIPVLPDGTHDLEETDAVVALRNLQQYVVAAAQREHAAPHSPARDAKWGSSHAAAKAAHDAAASPERSAIDARAAGR